MRVSAVRPAVATDPDGGFSSLPTRPQRGRSLRRDRDAPRSRRRRPPRRPCSSLPSPLPGQRRGRGAARRGADHAVHRRAAAATRHPSDRLGRQRQAPRVDDGRARCLPRHPRAAGDPTRGRVLLAGARLADESAGTDPAAGHATIVVSVGRRSRIPANTGRHTGRYRSAPRPRKRRSEPDCPDATSFEQPRMEIGRAAPASTARWWRSGTKSSSTRVCGNSSTYERPS